MSRIPLIRPAITDAVKAAVMDVLDSGHLTEGPVTNRFERSVGDFVGTAHALAVTSCTTGLELALRCLAIGPGDEVIVPDYTYPATASVVNIVGATAVIVDVDPASMLVDYEALEAAVTGRTRAAVPVSLFGNPLDWDRLNAIKERRGIFMVEDAACALGSAFRERMTGAWADISVFSHHPRKFITTGEGGTVTTQNGEWAGWMRSYKHFGMENDSDRGDVRFVRIGSNYKLSSVLAAIGLAQMQQVDGLLSERIRLAERYMDLLRDADGVEMPVITAGGRHSWQTFCVLVDERDRIMKELRRRGIEAQIGTYSLHMHPAFNENANCRFEGDLDGSRQAFKQALALPLFHGMATRDQEYVVERLLAEVSK